MKAFRTLCLAAGAAGLTYSMAGAPSRVTVVVSGDMKGYLSPCGCSYPMIGGIKRRAAAVGELAKSSSLVVVDNGGLVSGTTRQDEIKAETLAEALALMGADAVNLGAEEARLGKDMLASLQRLSGERLVCSQLPAPAPLGIKPFVAKGGYLIGGACAEPEPIGKALGVRPIPLDKAVARLVEEASKRRLQPFLLLRGSEAEARAVASRHPKLAVIVFSSSGDPLARPLRVGNTRLLTPGEFGKHLVLLQQDRKGSLSYRTAPLSPEYPDDTAMSGVYSAYLSRVKGERLLDQWPRVHTDAYAGSESCKGCHAEAYEIWQGSKHARALATLEKEGHDFDPDCVSCHVTGLSSKEGFVTRAQTPALANVGCESCHGPLAEHAKAPKDKRPGKARVPCFSCHNAGHSPQFDYWAYWPRISHR